MCLREHDGKDFYSPVGKQKLNKITFRPNDFFLQTVFFFPSEILQVLFAHAGKSVAYGGNLAHKVELSISSTLTEHRVLFFTFTIFSKISLTKKTKQWHVLHDLTPNKFLTGVFC